MIWTYQKTLLCVALSCAVWLGPDGGESVLANGAIPNSAVQSTSGTATASLTGRIGVPAAAQTLANKPLTDEALCRRATSAAEREHRIPKHLLTAISLAESGRGGTKEAAHAWPWTVMAEGEGRYFTSKEHAIAEVEVLLSQGVKNIDVGCMQVNLHFHWDAFETLEDAFDPARNVAYAAGFLKTNYDETRNWTAAAGQYHSRTADKAKPYRLKVIRLWNQVRAQESGAGAIARTNPRGENITGNGTVRVDDQRTKRLNAALRNRRQAERSDRREMTLAERRTTEILDWRNTRNRGVRLEAVVARRFAELEQNRRERLRALETNEQRLTFEQRRRQQLDRWRRTGDLGTR